MAREIESFERDISKYEQQSSDLISDAIKHGICVWRHGTPRSETAHRSISRLSTCKSLRDEIINYSRSRRTWTDPNATQVDAVHVTVNQDRQVDGSGSRSDKGKGGKGGKGMSKKGGKDKESGEKAADKFDGDCRYCENRGHKKADCRKMKSDIAAGKCDKSGRPIGVNSFTVTGATQPSLQANYAPSVASTTRASVLPRSRRQSVVSTDRDLVHQHDRTGPEDSHGCKHGRSRIRAVGFWIRLDVMPNQFCQ